MICSSSELKKELSCVVINWVVYKCFIWRPFDVGVSLELSSGDTCRSSFTIFGSCLTPLKRHNFVAMITYIHEL